MRRYIASAALVVVAVALAHHAGFPCARCGGVAFAAEPPKPPAPAKSDSPAPVDPPKPVASLKVGDKAPAIKADKWVKGSEIKSLDGGHVYLVEFWATWCPPCRESIPHLTEVQHKYKTDVTVVGIAGSERKGEKGEDKRLDKLEAFVKVQGDKMDYTIGYDQDRKMVDSWLKAAGKNEIPTVFIVDREGRIAWIGEPSTPEFDEAVERTVSGAKKNKT